MTDKIRYDYLVVGGGTAGAVIAACLAEDPDTGVCVLRVAVPSFLGRLPYAFDFSVP